MSAVNGSVLHKASFRDPAGYIFYSDEGLLRRGITSQGIIDYRKLMDSGLYASLAGQGKLISHKEVSVPNSDFELIIEPERIPIISYPYEWCFSQLKDAALLTLDIQLEAMKHDLSLKDASAFNVQFYRGKPIFIDTLSFEVLTETPWVAYKQFCEMFLAPLVMMSYVSQDHSRYLACHIDGLPLTSVSRAVGKRTYLNLGLAMHLHMHAKSIASSEAHASKAKLQATALKVSRFRQESLLDSLKSTILSLKPLTTKTRFSGYYQELDHYSREAERAKLDIIGQWAQLYAGQRVLDLGGNDGKYSRIFTAQGCEVVCVDADETSIDKNYLYAKNADPRMLALRLDIQNPSPSLGWDLQERESFFERVRPDLIVCLAFIHHLRITMNIPLGRIVEFFADKKAHLIIEFVSKEDIKVKECLSSRKDTFFDYSQEEFERAFSERFNLQKSEILPGQTRTLYHYRLKS